MTTIEPVFIARTWAELPAGLNARRVALRDSMRVDGDPTGDKLRLLPLQFMETTDAMH